MADENAVRVLSLPALCLLPTYGVGRASDRIGISLDLRSLQYLLETTSTELVNSVLRRHQIRDQGISATASGRADTRASRVSRLLLRLVLWSRIY